MIWFSSGGWWYSSQFETLNSKPMNREPQLLTPQAPFLTPTLPLAREKNHSRGWVFSCFRDKSVLNTLERRTTLGVGCFLVSETNLFSTPSPSFSARRAVQSAAATTPPMGQCVFLYSGHLCIQRPSPPRSARMATMGPAATALRARWAPTRTSWAQVGAAAPRIMLPVTHVIILADASDALG